MSEVWSEELLFTLLLGICFLPRIPAYLDNAQGGTGTGSCDAKKLQIRLS